MSRPSLSLWIAATLAAALALTGCGYQPQRTAPGNNPDAAVYRPPTLSVIQAEASPTPASQSAAGSAETTPTVACTDLLSFISDVTIPDGTVVEPGATLDKRWEVENSGTCNWGEGYTLQLVSGDAMGIDPAQDLFPARTGTRPVIRLLFTAPMEPGRYQSAWQAFNPDEQPFGDPFFIEIIVGNP